MDALATLFPIPYEADSIIGALALLFALLIGHSLADYPLQGEFLSTAKNRHAKLEKYFDGEAQPFGVWVIALGAHSLIHAGFVWLITGSIVLGLIELVLHAIIDYIKCEGITSFFSDQLLHVACKVMYVAFFWIGGFWWI